MISLRTILISLIIIIVGILFVTVLILRDDNNFLAKQYITSEKCCGGSMCTDTYYDENRDVCVLTMCPQWDRTKCEYKPK